MTRLIIRLLLLCLPATFLTTGVAPAHAGTAALSGVVRGPAGEGVAASVMVLRVNPDETFTSLGSVTSGSWGGYSFPGLELGTYVLRFNAVGSDTAYVEEYFDNADTAASATPITLAAGQTRTDVDVVLSTRPSISGRITDLAGDPLAGANVLLRTTEGVLHDSTYTDAQGRYLVRAHRPGRYVIEAAKYERVAQVGYWGGGTTWESATQIPLGDMATLNDHDLSLASYGALGGAIRGPGGASLPSGTALSVTLWRKEGPALFTPVQSYRPATSNPVDATYWFSALDRGQYTLQVQNTDRYYRDMFLGGASTPAEATWFSVADGTSPGPGDLTLTTLPVPLTRGWINGTFSPEQVPRVGDTLSMNTMPTTRLPSATVVNQWTKDGVDIPGATGATYRVRAADLGSSISSRGVASRPGWPDGHSTAMVATVAVQPALAPASLTPPTLVGVAKVGETLGVDPGTTDVPDAVAALQWLRDGAPIAGAIANSRRVRASDAGHRLSVQVTWTHPVRPSLVTATDPSTPIALGAPSRPSTPPSVRGVATVGSDLHAAPGAWPSGSVVGYQWLRNGTPIAGAVTSRYRLTPTDFSARLSVRVSGAAPGHQTGSSVSPVTPAVVALSTTRVNAKARAKGRVSLTITISSPGYSASALSGTVTVRLGRRQVGLVAVRQGRATVTLKRQRPGLRRYSAQWSGTRVIDPSSGSVKVKVRGR